MSAVAEPKRKRRGPVLLPIDQRPVLTQAEFCQTVACCWVKALPKLKAMGVLSDPPDDEHDGVWRTNGDRGDWRIAKWVVDLWVRKPRRYDEPVAGPAPVSIFSGGQR